ncbi:MAG: hypothetical protein MUF36_12235, partial [Bacteroidales bacterium]|nr:hypothetical protein [Bacteroidales bacterium]
MNKVLIILVIETYSINEIAMQEGDIYFTLPGCEPDLLFITESCFDGFVKSPALLLTSFLYSDLLLDSEEFRRGNIE